jgi:hypothetical protein
VILVCTAASARASADLPKDWVAQCGGRTLTLKGLATAMVARVREELLEKGSGPSTVLRQVVQERMVLQEAKRLGVGVTDEEVGRRFSELDREVRERSGGSQTLRNVMEKQEQSPSLFRLLLRNQMLKERIAMHPTWLGPKVPTDEHQRLAQFEAVVIEIQKKAKVVYGIPTANEAKPATLAPGVVATVNGEPITTEEFGIELARRLATDVVLGIIKAECKSVLSEKSALTEQEMEAEIAKERENWNRWRELSTQQALKTLSYDDYVKHWHRVSLEDLKRDRFFRGLFGLIRSFRAQVKPDDVLQEYEKNKATLYGPSIRVVDVQINFAQKNALVPQQGARERKDALRLANEILVKKESGMPFDQIAREVLALGDRSMTAKSVRLRDTNADRILWEKAATMADGDVALTETISAVHVIHREEGVPAPAFAEIQGMIAEGVAKKAAEKWLDESLKDERLVKIRWPLPDDAWPQRR